jgi:hypothetical protein
MCLQFHKVRQFIISKANPAKDVSHNPSEALPIRAGGMPADGNRLLESLMMIVSKYA